MKVICSNGASFHVSDTATREDIKKNIDLLYPGGVSFYLESDKKVGIVRRYLETGRLSIEGGY